MKSYASSYFASISGDTWPEDLQRHSAEMAHDTLAKMGAEKAVELAFATLQLYYTIVLANACPLLHNKEGVDTSHTLKALQAVFSTCGFSLESVIKPSEPDHL